MPTNMGCGCSIKILLWVGIIILALFLTGLIVGPLGSSLLGIEAPDILSVSKPHVELPSEGIFHISVFTITNTLIASWLTIIVLIGLFYACTRKMKLIPGRLQSLAEMIVETLLNFIEGASGEKHARVLFPVVATIFVYVLANAYLALLPFYGTVGIIEGEGTFVPLFRAANTDINVPLSIAIVSFAFVEYWGIRSAGFFRYLNGFFNFGQLRDGIVSLFKGKVNIDTYRFSPPPFCSHIGGFHYTGPAPGNDSVTSLGKLVGDLFGQLEIFIVRSGPGGTEYGNTGTDTGQLFESFHKFRHDLEYLPGIRSLDLVPVLLGKRSFYFILA